MQKLVSYVQGAKTSVHYIIFTYTHADLSSAMIERAKAGVDVQGVIENRGASQGAMVPIFCAGLPVRKDGNPNTMHHKVIVIDGQYVITGSFNFTKSADESNDDNILVIHSPAVAALYEQEFQKVFGQGKAPEPGEYPCS
jgi:phosphatidylserine/phosphatidylglycerophosphate/cardiolipin synthase-like enzyme